MFWCAITYAIRGFNDRVLKDISRFGHFIFVIISTALILRDGYFLSKIREIFCFASVFNFGDADFTHILRLKTFQKLGTIAEVRRDRKRYACRVFSNDRICFFPYFSVVAN